MAEKVMWSYLRNSKIGFKFRREHPIECYRIDFYCHEALLAVEMDGEQHEQARDAQRDAALARHGLMTYRIPNRTFFMLEPGRCPDFVAEIQRICEQRTGRKAFE